VCVCVCTYHMCVHAPRIRKRVNQRKCLCQSNEREESCVPAPISQPFKHLSQRVNVCVKAKVGKSLCAHTPISQAYEHLSQRVNVCVQAKEEKSKGTHAPFLHALKHF
jgi:hypothetical protein